MTEKQHPPARPGDQAFYKQWRAALERVIAASMARDAMMVGTPEREAAQGECDAALAVFRDMANQIRRRVIHGPLLDVVRRAQQACRSRRLICS
jgi:hypothetical protein